MNKTGSFPSSPAGGVGLYIHIPWCRQVCHYCDFAKTANHSGELRQNFIVALESQIATWLKWKEANGLANFSSVFFGGGTPSIYTTEYESIFTLIRPFLQPGAEVSLEANPDDISLSSLKIWQQLGFNRISLGVQTFDPVGLKTMHRVHSSSEARAAIDAALAVFPTVNIDLIYGWLDQSYASWLDDLSIATSLGIPHLSLYNLTYEPRTVIGRMAARGKINTADDERLESYYSQAREDLAAAGFDHEEVSNWSKPGHSCAHNWLYWSDRTYLGIGPGAHGYIENQSNPGVRYAYNRNERLFKPLGSPVVDGKELPVSAGVEIESDRTTESWMIESVSSSLRTNRGVHLRRIEQKIGRKFSPVTKLKDGIEAGRLSISSCGAYLQASPEEWFRENYWALAVIESF